MNVMTENKGALGRHRFFVGGFLFSSRRLHTRYLRDWSSDVCSSDLSGVFCWRAAADRLPASATASTIDMASRRFIRYFHIVEGYISILPDGHIFRKGLFAYRSNEQHPFEGGRTC